MLENPALTLVRNKASGRYDARLYLAVKEVWRSLKTTHFSVAEARLAAAKKEHRQLKGKQIDPANAKMTFGQAAELYMRSREESVGPKKRTRTYWREVGMACSRAGQVSPIWRFDASHQPPAANGLTIT